jgi:hypothetical protein
MKVSAAPQEIYGKMEIQLHQFLTSAREWSAALPRRLIPTEIKVWVNPLAGLDAEVKRTAILSTSGNEPQSSRHLTSILERGTSVLLMMMMPMIKG